MPKDGFDMLTKRSGDNNRGSGGGLAFLLIVLALILIVGPFLIPEHIIKITGFAQVLFAGFGVLLLLVGSIMIAFTQYYVKASSNLAFVRTGMGGPKVVLDGGALVLQQVHQVRFVSLETVKLVVDRMGKDALITGDNLRADVRAEFYIRVNRTDDGVKNAATTLGDKSGDDVAIMDLVGEKLISAMRTVAARSDLEHLHSQLDQYREDVKKIVEHDLEPNGLFLETVAVSHLNQTSPEHLSPETNLFDAQGLKKITEITSQQRIERSKIQTEADRTVKDQEVFRDKALYTLEVSQQSAAAERDSQIKKAKAEREREAAEFSAGERQKAEIAEVLATRTVELANVEKEQAIEVANQQRESAAQQATIEREKTVEVKKREREIAVANTEKLRAAAEQERITAETEREKANQGMITLTQTQQAERSKNITVINKEADAKTKQIERNMEADVEAYSKVKEAEAEQEAAVKKADATLILAKATQEARTLEAKGEESFKMVPVNVNKAQVSVDQAKVEVTRAQLEAQSQNEKMAFDLQVALAQIEADKQVRIEQAKALGAGLAASNMTIYGDPSTYAKMLSSFQNGQQLGQYVQGVVDRTPAEIKDIVLTSVNQFSAAAAHALKKLTGTDVDPAIIERLVKEQLDKEGK